MQTKSPADKVLKHLIVRRRIVCIFIYRGNLIFTHPENGTSRVRGSYDRRQKYFGVVCFKLGK